MLHRHIVLEKFATLFLSIFFHLACSVFVLLTMPACNLTEHPSSARFITFIHLEEYYPELRTQTWRNDYYSRLLINRIFTDQWHIVYDVPKKCSSRKTRDQIEESMRQAIRQWLQALKGISFNPLVDNFLFTQLPTYTNPKEDNEKERLFAKTDIEVLNPHLLAVFYCDKGRSYAYPWLNEIHIFTDPKEVKSYEGWRIGNTNYSYLTLIHEVGHTFGLADTYAEAYEDDDEKDNNNVSEIGDMFGNVKNQPPSVMSGVMKIGDPDQVRLLGKDDIEGIRWLYRYFHDKNTDIENCRHPDFEFEIIDSSENISGCRPTHPLIFEVKQQHINTSIKMIKHAPNININTQDQHGNTALHYAGLYGMCSVAQALLARPDIHKDVANNDGITPLAYAERAGYTRTAALLRSEKGARCKDKRKTGACASIGGKARDSDNAGRAGLLLVLFVFPVLLCSVWRFT